MKRLASVILLTGAVLSTGCASRTINQVLADPGRYRNREVKLSGAVVDSYSLVGRGAYRLDDRTGQLWIVSDRGVPHWVFSRRQDVGTCTWSSLKTMVLVGVSATVPFDRSPVVAAAVTVPEGGAAGV